MDVPYRLDVRQNILFTYISLVFVLWYKTLSVSTATQPVFEIGFRKLQAHGPFWVYEIEGLFVKY